MEKNEIILIFIIYVVAAVPSYFFFRKKLSKKFLYPKIDASAKKEIDSTINWLSFSLIGVYGIGIISTLLLGKVTLGVTLISIGVTLGIYFFQALENFRINLLLEKKLGSKIDKVNISKIEELIAYKTSEGIAERIDIEKLKKQIVEELKKAKKNS